MNNQQQFTTMASPVKTLSPSKQLAKGVGFQERIEKTIEKMVESSDRYYNSGSFKKITFKSVTKKTVKDGITSEKKENAYVNSSSKASTLLDTLSKNDYYLFNTLLQTSGVYENVLNYFASKFASGLTKLEYNSMIIFGVYCLTTSSFTSRDVDVTGLLNHLASSEIVFRFMGKNSMREMIVTFTAEIKNYLLELESTLDLSQYESIYNHDSINGGEKLAKLVSSVQQNSDIRNYFVGLLTNYCSKMSKSNYLKTIMENKAEASDKIITLDNVYNIAVDANFIKLDETPFEIFESKQNRRVGKDFEKLNSYHRSYEIVKKDRKDQTYITGTKETSDLVLSTIMGFFYQDGDTQEQRNKKNEKLNKLKERKSYIDFADFPDSSKGSRTAGLHLKPTTKNTLFISGYPPNSVLGNQETNYGDFLFSVLGFSNKDSLDSIKNSPQWKTLLNILKEKLQLSRETYNQGVVMQGKYQGVLSPVLSSPQRPDISTTVHHHNQFPQQYPPTGMTQVHHTNSPAANHTLGGSRDHQVRSRSNGESGESGESFAGF